MRKKKPYQKVELFKSHFLSPLSHDGFVAHRNGVCLVDAVVARGEVVDLGLSLHHVHRPVMVVVGKGAARGVGRQGQVVGAEAVPLCVRIAKQPGLQELVLRGSDPGHRDGRAKGQLLVFIEEIHNVLIEDHPAHRLQGEDVLGPDLGNEFKQRVEKNQWILEGGMDESLDLRILEYKQHTVYTLVGSRGDSKTRREGE